MLKVATWGIVKDACGQTEQGNMMWQRFFSLVAIPDN
jgi:hypothetical protein